MSANSGQLEKMANDIGDFFRGESDREQAIAGIKNHIRRFWTPHMQQKLRAQVERGEVHLHDLPDEAVRRLNEPLEVEAEPPGGDAG